MQIKSTERKEGLRDGDRQQDLMIIFRTLGLKDLLPYEPLKKFPFFSRAYLSGTLSFATKKGKNKSD